MIGMAGRPVMFVISLRVSVFTLFQWRQMAVIFATASGAVPYIWAARQISFSDI